MKCVIVRDSADCSVYLSEGGAWASSGKDARVFPTYRTALDWIKRQSIGYWLIDCYGRARVISARAAGKS